MTWTVIISESAEADLLAIYRYIAERAGEDTAPKRVEDAR
jgi:plasmid stabilization system protein ParE